MDDLEAIEAALRAEPSDLRGSIGADIGCFTVALFGVFASEDGDRLELAGTGSLVTVEENPYVLTAAHVWDRVLRSARMVGITLKENTDHRFLIDTKEIAAYGPPYPTIWNQCGPDLTFLRLPRERVGAITVYRTFYNLTRPRTTNVDVDHIEIWVLMGTPHALGNFTDTHADLQINGFFTQAGAAPQTRDGFDYVDLDVDVSFPGTPASFGGVSGGGLWKVLVYRVAATGKIDWLSTLEGVAFHQSAVANGHRVIRCHGPQSIRTAMPTAA